MSKERESYPTHQEIATLAYRKFLERGGQDGRAIDDWLEAERELHRGRVLAEAAIGLYSNPSY
jgi:Protein of unknown function (DUF2934)